MRKIIQLGTRLPPLTLSWGSREIYSSKGALTEMKTSTQITFMEDAPQLLSETEERKCQKSSGSSICHREEKICFLSALQPMLKIEFETHKDALGCSYFLHHLQ